MSAAQHRFRRIVAMTIALLPAASAPALAASADAKIHPGSPQAEQAIARLKHAASIDCQNSKAHSGAADSDLGIYYAEKAKEADALLRELNSGQAVSEADVERALNTTKASRFRAY